MQKLYCQSVADYVDAIGPHDKHETFRCDDPARALLGRGCTEHAVEIYIPIADFKRTGDLPEYERLMEAKFPEKKDGKSA
jgi:hypothetical protein